MTKERPDILIVEDNLADIAILRSTMKSRGAHLQIEVASDGDEALTILRESRPRLILLDLNLPRIGGLDCLVAIKSQPHLMDIPVVVWTGSSSPGEISEAYQRGATLFLTKPLRLKEYDGVIDVLKRILSKSGSL